MAHSAWLIDLLTACYTWQHVFSKIGDIRHDDDVEYRIVRL